jgi:uncharacterized protein (DUF2235 family)
MPTNVLRLARGVRPVGPGDRRQVVFYDWGVGSDGKKLSGGIAGGGIDKNIQDIYRYLVHNYEPGDHIYLFGFSRGAYTVRSLAGFIRNCGVLKRKESERIPEAYALYRRRPSSTSPNAQRSRDFRAAYAIADITPIRFAGVFDTVGTLGVPVTFWGLLDNDEYLFHDTSPSKIIQTARHAVSIDEDRNDFKPTLWDPKPELDLEQVWFSGVHCDVGGGYKERGLSDTAMQWMLKEARAAGLAIEAHVGADINPDHLSKQHNERKGVYKLRGKSVREIPADALVHRSVKQRRTDGAITKRSRAIEAFLSLHGGDWTRVRLKS